MKFNVVFVVIYTCLMKIGLSALLPTKILSNGNATEINSTCIIAKVIFIEEGLQEDDIYNNEESGK